MRIGALSRQTGVAPELLRAWERRYGLLRPERTEGGFRLYTSADRVRVERMKELIGSGVSAAEAARVAAVAVAEAETPAGTREPGFDRESLSEALMSFDEGRAQAALDRLFGRLSVEAVMRDVLLPELREIGARWERGEINVAQEHFASNVIRGRLMGLTRGWDSGDGPRAVLACAAGELHDLSLIMFGVALHRLGWRITYLGADTPTGQLMETARTLSPRIIVLVSTVSEHYRTEIAGLRDLAREGQLVLAGAGATRELARELSARVLEEEPVSAAATIAAAYPRGS
jgi:methanogenic corrinoid protein MtbC1